jgi:hypothetical protein
VISGQVWRHTDDPWEGSCPDLITKLISSQSSRDIDLPQKANPAVFRKLQLSSPCSGVLFGPTPSPIAGLYFEDPNLKRHSGLSPFDSEGTDETVAGIVRATGFPDFESLSAERPRLIKTEPVCLRNLKYEAIAGLNSAYGGEVSREEAGVG